MQIPEITGMKIRNTMNIGEVPNFRNDSNLKKK
jgi:hypothetical protein